MGPRQPPTQWVPGLFPGFRGQFKRDGTRTETRFRLPAKRTSPFKLAGGASVQSTTGSRDVRISGSNAGYTMFRGSVKGTGYPLHSPVPPFTSPPVRHRVPSHFNRSLQRPGREVTHLPPPSGQVQNEQRCMPSCRGQRKLSLLYLSRIYIPHPNISDLRVQFQQLPRVKVRILHFGSNARLCVS